MSKSIALVYNTDTYLYRFRRGLMRALTEHGYVVYAIAPPGRYAEVIEETGAIFVPWALSRSSFNPFRELLSIFSLLRIYRRLRPTVAHHLTIKPYIYGSIAARLAKTPKVVSSVNGLGFPFTGRTWKAKMLGAFLRPLYWLAFALSDVVTFQNESDRDTFINLKLLSKDKARFVQGGSGVDLSYFRRGASDIPTLAAMRTRLGIQSDSIVVALVSRMLHEKGVSEYVAAAQSLRDRFPEARFFLVGPTDEGNPSSVPMAQLTRWSRQNAVEYLGEQQDVREVLALTDIATLPSYYPEGMPRALMEASAMGVPCVTTDTPGCRDVVEHGVTGFLVPPRDVDALGSAMAALLMDSDLRSKYGLAARAKAEREFDEKLVIAQIVRLYERLGEEESADSYDGMHP